MKYKKPIPEKRKILYCDCFNGVNTAQNIAVIDPSQLSESVNLWNKDGVLQTRPGLADAVRVHLKDANASETRLFEGMLTPFSADNYRKIFAVAERTETELVISAFLADENSAVKNITPITFADSGEEIKAELQNILFVSDSSSSSGTGIFMVVVLNYYVNSLLRKFVSYYELNSSLEEWNIYDKDRFYVPTVLRNGRGNNFSAAYDPEGLDTVFPEALEGVNVVNGRFRAYYRSDGFSFLFKLPVDNVSNGLREVVQVNYLTSSGQVSFVVPAGADSSPAVTVGDKEITAHIDRETAEVYFTVNDQLSALEHTASTLNDICIIANTSVGDIAYELFANSAESAYADARLLRLSVENQSNKIYFSGRENPFYFTEDNYFEVGSKDEPLTAIAHQNRYLFAFKDTSIYRLKLSDTSSYDITQIVEKGLNYKAEKPALTLTTVHSTIGCDCPATIRFCQNRLVWYHSDGAVYTLYGTNTYTEGSIYMLSPNISNLLNISSVQKDKISACVCGGYYFLNYMNMIFVMDAKVSGFTYLSGNPVKTDANGGLNWFYWELPQLVRLRCLYAFREKLFAVCESNPKDGVIFLANFSGTQDEIIRDEETWGVTNVKFVFASALFGKEIRQKKLLKKASILIKNGIEASAYIFTLQETGEKCKIKSRSSLKRANVFLSSAQVESAGVRIEGIAPALIGDVAFEFSVGG